MPEQAKSPFSIPNIRRYIAFKVLFNSRFYYPVFTILFLDFGLTIAQFAILNAVWAATIVLAEVPSGALADVIGRKRLLVFATLTMVLEVGMISFVPKSDLSLVFYVFLINRILSGLAEAAASGADEALAYDALKNQGNPDDWGRVLEVLARFQSLGFIIAMSAGAALYDPRLMEGFCRFFGISLSLTQEMTMRFPLYATLVLAIFACAATMGMEEKNPAQPDDTRPLGWIPRVKQAFDLTFKAGAWIFKTPFVLSVILFGMLFDGIIRMVITLSSQYYRMIQLPESLFGIIGSTVALLGFVIPRMARKIAEREAPVQGLWVTAILTISGLTAMSFFWPWTGLIPALVTFSAMYFNGFFVSFYVNRETASEQRATVLSFKGLSYNFSYGILGIGYALLLKSKRQALESKFYLADKQVEPAMIENLTFTESFPWFPGTFLAGFVFLCLVYLFFIRNRISK
ncbi:MAG: MFS transporter [Proteobacteria bacterium]|nr:MFS transporter [Desulfobacula sp.]MBU3954758.1 MFS transporter [Pseudomonadota bacterium]MBU4131946.1 MFS transporter [Pseudomonadota bacterium]